MKWKHVMKGEDFIDDFARFLIVNYQKEFQDIVVIMNSGLECKLLQNSLIKLSPSSSFFLPEIFPILSQEDLDIKKYFYNIIDANEAILIFTQYLLNKQFTKDFASALNISKQLLNLYSEFIFNDISIHAVNSLFLNDISDQVDKNLKIINQLFNYYENYQKQNHKIDLNLFQKETLLGNYHKNKKIIIGIIEPSNNLFDEFIKNTIDSGGIYFGDLRKDVQNIKKSKKINIVELADEFEEAAYISDLCKNHKHKKILIVSNNIFLNNLLSINFTRDDLSYNDYSYCQMQNKNFLDLFINIIDFLINGFDIKKLLLIIKSPLIINEHVYEIEYKILKKKTFIKDLDSIIQDSKYSCSEKTFTWLDNFSKILKTFKPKSIANHIEIIKKISNFIKINIDEYEKYFELVSGFSLYFDVLNNENYLIYLKYLIDNHSISIESKNSNIIISRIKNACLFSEIDIVIIPSFVDNYWPKKNELQGILNDSMKANLGISVVDKEESLRIILNLIDRKEVYISFPRKINSEIINKSKYLYIIGSYPIECFSLATTHNSSKATEYVVLESKLMPTKISVTNIEMMIRNPYGFYVKHILKIKPLKSSIPELKLSEFGIFIHAILERYTKNYNIENYSNKLDTIINIAKSIYEDLNKVYQTPISWLYKFKKIAQSFIEFDENRRSNLSYVLSETYGEIDLLIGKRNIKITAIADRIEVGKNNEIYILDYKTGTVPTIKSVYQGLSPQLIVEAIIAKYGYFTNLESNNITKIIYVKISISEPYFVCTEIEMNEEIISSTLENLKKLLNYYYNSDHIRINKSELNIAPEYNDYVHMMRKMF